MFPILHRLDTLRRPQLLIRAARIGADDYRREVHLPRILGHGPLPRHASALEQLMDKEDEMDRGRRDHAPDYAMVTHVEVMIAIIAEARVLRAVQQSLFPAEKHLPGYVPDTGKARRLDLAAHLAKQVVSRP